MGTGGTHGCVEVRESERSAPGRSRLQLLTSAAIGFIAVVLFDRASAGDTPTSVPASPDTVLAPAVVVAAGADFIDTNSVTRVVGTSSAGSRSGTAFALDDGRIATVAHALIDARNIRLGVGPDAGDLDSADGNTRVVIDRGNDLAAIAGAGLPAQLTSASEPAAVGQNVAVAGLGRDERIGVVTGAIVGRSPGSAYGVAHPDVFAISAPVSEGWSGGPVVDARGQVVAIVVGQDRTSGVTLAVPIEYLPKL